MTRLLDCLRWLGALTLRELVHALQRPIPTVRHYLARAGIRQGSDGRYHLPAVMHGPPCPRGSVLDIQAALRGGPPPSARALAKRSGYCVVVVMRVLAYLGWRATGRGRGARWVRA